MHRVESMKPLPHHYNVRLSGGPFGYATLSLDGAPDLRSAPPLEFDGPGDAWGPEHLLLAAVGTCFAFTLRAVAHASKVEFSEIAISTEGVVDRAQGATRFTGIVLRVRLAIPAGVSRDKALRVLDKSERACIVSASLATPIQVEPEIEVR